MNGPVWARRCIAMSSSCLRPGRSLSLSFPDCADRPVWSCGKSSSRLGQIPEPGPGQEGERKCLKGLRSERSTSARSRYPASSAERGRPCSSFTVSRKTRRCGPAWHRDWRRIHTVVCADLRGYGDSSKPRCLPDKSNYSFRAMARDQLDLMRSLDFDRFHVIGHDRGGRTGHRLALDHPQAVASLAVSPSNGASAAAIRKTLPSLAGTSLSINILRKWPRC